MSERPIIFNSEMVRAVLEGRKTQTRRIMKVQPTPSKTKEGDFWFPCKKMESMVHISDLIPDEHGAWPAHEFFSMSCPLGAVGDRLWVRETWRGVVAINAPEDHLEWDVARYVPDQKHCQEVHYRATHEVDKKPWRPYTHMPRWASRITLEITGVRVERLQDISAEDVTAEGIKTLGESMWGPKWWVDASQAALNDAQLQFSIIWSKIYGEESWKANPWVWVIEFKREEDQ